MGVAIAVLATEVGPESAEVVVVVVMVGDDVDVFVTDDVEEADVVVADTDVVVADDEECVDVVALNVELVTELRELLVVVDDVGVVVGVLRWQFANEPS